MGAVGARSSVSRMKYKSAQCGCDVPLYVQSSLSETAASVNQTCSRGERGGTAHDNLLTAHSCHSCFPGVAFSSLVVPLCRGHCDGLAEIRVSFVAAVHIRPWCCMGCSLMSAPALIRRDCRALYLRRADGILLSATQCTQRRARG